MRRDDNAFRRYKRLGLDSDTVFTRRVNLADLISGIFLGEGLRETRGSSQDPPLRAPADSAVKIVIISTRGIYREVYHYTRAYCDVVTRTAIASLCLSLSDINRSNIAAAGTLNIDIFRRDVNIRVYFTL